jgi:hypothetical protein
MDSLNNENPNPPNPPVDGTFGLIGLEKGERYTVWVIPRNATVTGYTIEFAFYPSERTDEPIAPSQAMWYWSANDREEVTLPGGGGTPEAQRLGGEPFLVEKPAGYDWGYVRISDLLGTGNPGVDLLIYRDSP